MEDKRDTGLYFKLSAKELDLIHQKKALTGIRNTSAYLRKIAMDGYVINLDIKQLNEILRLLGINQGGGHCDMAMIRPTIFMEVFMLQQD